MCVGSAGAAAPRISDVEDANLVLSRARPEYEPPGIRLGGFVLTPVVSATLAYDDNVFGSDSVSVRDVEAVINPRIVLRSNWNVHSLTLSADGAAERFLDTRSENEERFDLRGDGELEIRRSLALDAGARFARLIEPRGSAGDAFIGGTPVTYHLAGATGAVRWSPNRLDIQAGGSVTDYSYAAVILNGRRIAQSFRDRRELAADVRLGYALGPGIALYARGDLSRVEYGNRDSGFDLDSRGYAVLGGISFAFSRLLLGEVGVGYISQSFADRRFTDVGGVNYSARLSWNPTPLLSATARASKSIQQAGIVGVAGVVRRDLAFSLDHELLRNLLLHAELAALKQNYRGIDRRDRLVTAEAGARYLVDRQLSIELRYQRRAQSSAGAARRAFAGNRIELSVRIQE